MTRAKDSAKVQLLAWIGMFFLWSGICFWVEKALDKSGLGLSVGWYFFIFFLPAVILAAVLSHYMALYYAPDSEASNSEDERADSKS